MPARHNREKKPAGTKLPDGSAFFKATVPTVKEKPNVRKHHVKAKGKAEGRKEEVEVLKAPSTRAIQRTPPAYDRGMVTRTEREIFKR